MEIWYFCQEAAEALEALRHQFPDKVKKDGKVEHNKKYWEAAKFVGSVCPTCMQDLPDILRRIMRAKKYKQEGCCPDSCDIPSMVRALRPVTPDKLLNAGWRAKVKELNHYVCCVKIKIQEDYVKDNNTFPHFAEIPNHSVKGLMDFNYPTYRIPPLFKLKIKLNEDAQKVKEEGYSLLKGKIGWNGKKIEPKDTFDVKIKPTFNANGMSKYFGVQWRMYADFPTSPFEFLYDLICDKDIVKFSGSFKAKFSIKLPNLQFSPHITINVDPCFAKYLPPIATPTVELKTLSLGDGEEFGVYSNYKLEANNFGTGFDPNSNKIAPLVKTSEETFVKVPRVSKDKQMGLSKEVSFPNYGKGREWTEE